MAQEPPVHQEHPELHHYTDANGLRGIWTSGELWATHYQRLNDRNEVIEAKNRLIDALTRRLIPEALLRSRSEPALAAYLSRQGINRSVEHEARSFIDALYAVTYEAGPETELAFATPFIVSFCSHYGDDTWVQRNGLLSQWRGYGGRNGARYAIVFDTLKLEALLRADFEAFEHNHYSLTDVVYENGDDVFRQRFAADIRIFFEALSGAIFDHNFPSLRAAYPSFVGVSTRFKHRAFMEEREVRIVCSPMLPEMLALLQRQGGFASHKPLRQIYRTGVVERLHLFENTRGLGAAIKRIIVGPSTDQAAAERLARDLVGEAVSVIISDAPFNA